MQTPRTIVIIGAGEIGQALTRGLSVNRDKVILCDADFNQACSFVEQLKSTNPASDVEALLCSYEATWEADIILLACATCNEKKDIARKIRPVASQKIVVTVEEGVKELEELLPDSHIVQAFTGLQVTDFERSYSQKNTIECMISGKDQEALNTVTGLVETLGFKPSPCPIL